MSRFQSGEFAQVALHRVDMDNQDGGGGGAAAAGTFQSRREERMVVQTSSEVTGNTARENSTMYNADVNRRTLNQTFNLHVSTQDGQYQMNRLRSGRAQEFLQDVEMQGVTASALSQLSFSSGSFHNVRTPQSDQVVFAWKQQSEDLIDEIHTIIASIREKHEGLNQKFRLVGRKSSAGEDFEAHEKLFEVTVEDGQLCNCIKETARKEQQIIEEASHYFEKFPNRAPRVVKEVRDRLGQILESLRRIDRYLGDANSIRLMLRYSKRGKQKPKKTSKPLGASRSAVQKSQPNHGRRDVPGQSVLPPRDIKVLESKMKVLLELGSAFREFMARKLSPPSDESRTMPDPDPECVLPEEVELAQVAAAMLYDSLGSVCPVPNHDSHTVCFKLGTEESIRVVREGTKRGILGLSVAFESSTTSQIWFDVASHVTAADGEQPFENALPEYMDTDSAVQSATSDVPFDLASMSRQQQQARLRSRHPFLLLRNEHSVENTAQFCLYNHRQQTQELAAHLKHSEACEHYLWYPEKKCLPKDVQTQNLCTLVRERLSHRERVRLARIIAESVLKFNATEWFREDLDAENVLVYTINETYEPHLKVQIMKPGLPGPISPGADKRLSQNLVKLTGILCDIALGASGRRRNDNDERLYARVKRQLNMGYAEVVRACHNMAKMQSPDAMSNEGVMTAFYTKVVKSLRELEKCFKVS